MNYKNFYFIGIGGIGMSALARYFHSLGKKVLGYDKTETKLTQKLQEEGIAITFTDEISPEIKDLKKEDTLVIFTPAIKQLGILEYFQNQGFEVMKRAKVLGLITQNTECIAVAGTHGKTTTSSLVAHLCKEADLPFSGFLGGISENFGSNFIFNGNQYSVLEADEYDRSFLNLSPNWAIITSTDADHLDIYGDTATIEEGFNEFADLIENEQQLFVRKGIKINRKAKTYAVNEEADYYSDNLRLVSDTIAFDFHLPNGETYPFEWEIPGIHNVENATGALALLHNLGVEISVLQKALSNFKGIKRRYTKHTFENGKIYIDDYAHHPTELNAVIGSIRTFYPEKRLLVAFQPHLFSRTKDFADGFAESLAQVDELLLLDIYPARELQEHFEGITSEWLLKKVNLQPKERCSLSEAFGKIQEKDFDILLTVGAGNIDTLYDPIVEWLNRESEKEYMETLKLLKNLNKAIINIYDKEGLISLRGKNGSHILPNGKGTLAWLHNITRHRNCHFSNDRYDYDRYITDLIFISDEIIYFTANMYLYHPYVNTPIKNEKYDDKGRSYFPIEQDVPTKRYLMFMRSCYEKVYNYWDRIADLIATFFPSYFTGNIYFQDVMKELNKHYATNQDFQWLYDFWNNEYKAFNKDRIKIVHTISQNVDDAWDYLGDRGFIDREKAEEYSEKLLSYPEYFKKMNDLCKEGFVKTLSFLEYVNNDKGYKCPN